MYLNCVTGSESTISFELWMLTEWQTKSLNFTGMQAKYFYDISSLLLYFWMWWEFIYWWQKTLNISSSAHIYLMYFERIANAVYISIRVMCCLVWDQEDNTCLWSMDMSLLQLINQSERTICSKRKFFNESVDGEIYNSSCYNEITQIVI